MSLVEGRLAGRTINTDMKIWLKTPIEVRAQRIARRENISFERALDDTRNKKICELTQYKKHYNIDLYDLSFYDLIIDTAKWDAAGVSGIVFAAIDALNKKQG
jgi:cytidylate kinase